MSGAAPELFGPQPPSVRLGNPGRDDAKAQALGPQTAEWPKVRLAHVDGAQGDGALQGTNGFQCTEAEAPALLVSYYYLEPFLKNQERYMYRDWVMDSGAFSAFNSGGSVDLSRYTDKCLELLSKDPTLSEVYSLDVIPKHGEKDSQKERLACAAKAAEQSLKNAEEMWRQGVPAIPTFHQGEPEEFLLQMAREFPKLALGGVALERGDFKLAWLEQCFARIWPKKVHGFGMSGEEIVYALPFHSVDATNWELAPCAFGNWVKFGTMSVRGSEQDLRSQVRHYLEVEEKARVRWAKEMSLLESLKDPRPTPAVRLSANIPNLGASYEKRLEKAISTPKKAPEPSKPKPAGELDPKWQKNWWE